MLEVILRQGPVSRAELARITGLSKQTTSEVVRTLLEGGWVRVQGQVQGATGRSAAILDRYHGLGGAPAEDVRAVFDRLEQGDPAAGATMDEVARLLAQVCMALRAVLDPERIVFGGSIGARAPLLERVRALLDRHMADPVPVQASALGSRAAIAGGVGLALTRLHDSLFIP